MCLQIFQQFRHIRLVQDFEPLLYVFDLGGEKVIGGVHILCFIINRLHLHYSRQLLIL